MTPAQQEALDAVELHGGVMAGARSLNISKSAMQDRLGRAKANLEAESDPAVKAAMQSLGMEDLNDDTWLKSKPNADGYSFSRLIRAPKKEAATAEGILDRIAAAFADIPASPAVAPPTNAADDLCALFPLYDVHWGMHAWGAETGGQDYDLKLAESDLLGAFDRVLAVTPDCGHAVILIGGDFFHADDTRNETPAHHHKLDSDGRFFKTIDTAIRALDHIIRRVQAKASTVTVRVMRGNHDEHSHLPLTFALAERFRDSRVTVLKEPRDLFMFQWGRAGIFGHHGDKSTPTEFVLKLADVCPFWTESPHRKAYTGHRHKMAAQRIGGVAWEQLDAFCPPDAYGSTWTGRRSFKADVFSKQSGLFMSAYDPLERAA